MPGHAPYLVTIFVTFMQTTNTTKWKEYEDIQSDIFDHILASIHYFALEAYQEPTSKDLKSLIKYYEGNKKSNDLLDSGDDWPGF